jgi:hypothetical protein
MYSPSEKGATEHIGPFQSNEEATSAMKSISHRGFTVYRKETE